MDGARFDDLAKAVAGRVSRRGVLRGALAAVAASVGLRGADAEAKRRCKAGDTECGDRCCKPETICCDGRCLLPKKLQTDRQNCGACGNVCPAGASCVHGECQCRAGFSECDGRCVKLTKDRNNCGACGNVCGPNQLCRDGACTCIVAGQTACGLDCVDLPTDVNNCGSCGNACGVDDVCCEGTCANLAHSFDHCGVCGNACGSTEYCETGTCTPQGPTLGCAANSICERTCPQTRDGDCTCGTTMTGDPVCYRDIHGCAGHLCETNGDCTADYGAESTCVIGFCTLPAALCSTDADCEPGSGCINVNGGCGGCDNYTGSDKGYCNPICTG